jgi:hypothetical protein
VIIGALLVRGLTTVANGRAAGAAGEPRGHVLGPPFVPGRGPSTSAWREEAITRANERRRSDAPHRC